MLIQTAEHRHYRDLPPGQWWPHDAQGKWWRTARRQCKRERERTAARCLDRWKHHATFKLLGSLLGPEQNGFIELTQMRTCPLDLISVTPKCAFSSVRRLRRGFESSWGTIRRTSDNATTTPLFAGEDRTDVGAIVTHCGAVSGTVTAWNDQGTSGNNIAGTAAASEPTIWTGTALKTTSGGLPALSFDGGDYLRRAGIMSMSGNGPITALLAFKALSAPNNAVYWAIGTSGTGGPNAQELVQSTTATLIDFNNNQRHVYWTCSTVLTESHIVAINPGTGDTSTYLVRQNGGALTVSSSDVANTLSLGTAWTAIGCHLDFSSRFSTMLCTAWVVWNASLSAADLAAAEELGRMHAY